MRKQILRLTRLAENPSGRRVHFRNSQSKDRQCSLSLSHNTPTQIAGNDVESYQSYNPDHITLLPVITILL